MKTLRFAAAFVFGLTACRSNVIEVVPPPPPATINSFTATPKTLTMPGEMVTLAWSTKDAKRITLEQIGKGPITISATEPTGSVQVAVSADTTFVLTAAGEGGTDSSVQSVTLTGSTGGFVFDAAPRRLQPGESTTLVWNVPGATSVTIKPAGGAPLDLKGQTASGSIVVSPAVDTKYELSTEMPLGSVDVVVVPSIVSFTAGPSQQAGQPITLSWVVAGGGTKLTIERDGAAMPLLTEMNAGNIARGQLMDTPPALPAESIYTYHLKLEHAGTTQTADLTVRVAGTLLVTSFVAPTWVQPGFPFTVSWRTVGATSVEVQADGLPVYVAPSLGAVAAGATTLPGLALGGSQRIKLVVRNDRGGEVLREKTVTAVGAPAFVSFTADKSTIAAGGEAVVLSWNVTNAREVRITQDVAGTVHLASGVVDMGTVTVFPNRAISRYTLFASNGAGQSVPAASVTVTVGTVAQLTFQGPASVGGDAGVVTGHTVPGGTEIFGLPVVVKNQPGEAFIDITGSNELVTANTDATGDLNPIGETFSTRVYGDRVSSQNLYVSPNGWFSLVDGYFAGPNVNQPIGNSLLGGSIAPYFRNLRLVTGISRIWGRVDSVGTERRLIIQWTDVEDAAALGSRLTFQAQVYGGGKIVFAYSKLDGIAAANGDIGVVNATNTRVLQPSAPPVVGDTFTFFGPATVPFTLPTVENTVYVARVSVGGGFIEVEGDARYMLQITEANPRPAAGITDGEWLEIQNTTAFPLDLGGYTLSFGGTNNHVIAGPVIVPANGRIVLAQALDLGDPTAGVSAAYVYPSTLTMPDASGSVSLVIGGTTYSQLAWTSTSAPAAGTSVLADTQLAEGAYAGSIVCPATGAGTYGLQVGNPGAVSPLRCFPYVLTRVAGAFESIATTGTAINTATANDAIYTVATPVMYYGASVPTIYVSTNGWITTTSTTVTGATAKTTPSTSAPAGSIAPWWMDHAMTLGMGNGIFREVKDPDGTPANGDEYTIISWENFYFSGFDSHRLNFQVKFFANGNLEYHYGNLSSPGRDFDKGSFGTVWLEDRTGRGAIAASLFSTTPGISTTTAFRYTYTP